MQYATVTDTIVEALPVLSIYLMFILESDTETNAETM